ncbi:hypothetical protein ACTXG6_15575 [Pseudonocardia sp. Cha107L01]|uniref:hypothetical protein n=1 Tax=Pseudonocardia sp. Cha107L01 TaxID=3457576 RepID=UPI00403EAD99
MHVRVGLGASPGARWSWPLTGAAYRARRGVPGPAWRTGVGVAYRGRRGVPGPGAAYRAPARPGVTELHTVQVFYAGNLPPVQLGNSRHLVGHLAVPVRRLGQPAVRRPGPVVRRW